MALTDALAAWGGLWFGWSGGTAAQRSEAPQVVTDGGIDFATVPLTEHDFELYYGGYANSVLWPLFHERLHAMDYHDGYREAYADVNAYFAAQLVPLLGPDDVLWVHDYHLLALAKELRQRGVSVPIGFFLHIPFPPFDVYRALPWGEQLLDDMVDFDLVGLQTRTDSRNFADALQRGLGAPVERDADVARRDGRAVRFGAFPIGVDVEAIATTAHANRDTLDGQRLQRAMRGRRLVIGADRLDYTKGLIERFHAYERFLERYSNEFDDMVIYIQITAPSRQDVQEYRELTRQLEWEAGRINGRSCTYYWTPLRFIEQQVARENVLGFFSLAHVGLVTPLRDGMNLVAKEFLAAQTAEDPGVLILSRMAGAVEELGDVPILVNPYNIEEVADGVREALAMPLVERRRRWERGMEVLEANTASAWRERFLAALSAIAQPVNGEGAS